MEFRTYFALRVSVGISTSDIGGLDLSLIVGNSFLATIR